jgi:hypothetical protein
MRKFSLLGVKIEETNLLENILGMKIEESSLAEDNSWTNLVICLGVKIAQKVQNFHATNQALLIGCICLENTLVEFLIQPIGIPETIKEWLPKFQIDEFDFAVSMAEMLKNFTRLNGLIISKSRTFKLRSQV